MKLLLLNGHGISLRVDGAKLHIRDGRYSTAEEPEEYVFAPKRIDIDNIVIYGRNGNITIDAIRWLIKHNVQISILDWNGKLLTTMLPPESVQVKTKFAQYAAYKDAKLRVEMAKKLITAKFAKTQLVLDWLKQRYSTVNHDFSHESQSLKRMDTIGDIMMVEGRVAAFYWQELIKVLPKKYEFETREYRKKPWGAGDKVNCMLNYGYAILEAECMRAINSAGLDVHVGFMHEMAMGKNSLAYDLQEPFRFLIDLAVISALEKGIMQKNDFIRTENYNLRLRPTGTKKLTAEINSQFNRKVVYKGKECSWSYVIQLKTRELTQFVLTKSRNIDFSDPSGVLEREDNSELRKQILAIGYTEWRKRGFSKGNLHYLKQNVQSGKPFRVYGKVKEKLLAVK